MAIESSIGISSSLEPCTRQSLILAFSSSFPPLSFFILSPSSFCTVFSFFKMNKYVALVKQIVSSGWLVEQFRGYIGHCIVKHGDEKEVFDEGGHSGRQRVRLFCLFFPVCRALLAYPAELDRWLDICDSKGVIGGRG